MSEGEFPPLDIRMNYQLNVFQTPALELAGDEVHIWSAALDRPVSPYYSLLAADERNRAGRFHFKKDRNRFIVRRGILRILLGCYLGVEPERVQFTYGKNDKPALADDLNRNKIHFSLSHSEGLAVYAFTHLGEIGVDIERIRDITNTMQIAGRYFSSGESKTLGILPGSRKKQGFYNCWTRKEAFVKATGDGLSCPLDDFEVSLEPGEPARLISIGNDPGAAAGWSMYDIGLPSGFAGALAVRGEAREIRCREWAGRK